MSDPGDYPDVTRSDDDVLAAAAQQLSALVPDRPPLPTRELALVLADGLPARLGVRGRLGGFAASVRGIGPRVAGLGLLAKITLAAGVAAAGVGGAATAVELSHGSSGHSRDLPGHDQHGATSPSPAATPTTVPSSPRPTAEAGDDHGGSGSGSDDGRSSGGSDDKGSGSGSDSGSGSGSGSGSDDGSGSGTSGSDSGSSTTSGDSGSGGSGSESGDSGTGGSGSADSGSGGSGSGDSGSGSGSGSGGSDSGSSGGGTSDGGTSGGGSTSGG